MNRYLTDEELSSLIEEMEQQELYAPKHLKEQMSSYLTNFAKNGDPNGDGLPKWEAVTGKGSPVLRLGQGDTRMGKPNMAKLIWTMLTHKAVGE